MVGFYSFKSLHVYKSNERYTNYTKSINIVSEKKYRNLFCLILANINDRTATNVKRKPISDILITLYYKIC